jgi:hypothetical protein
MTKPTSPWTVFCNVPGADIAGSDAQSSANDSLDGGSPSAQQLQPQSWRHAIRYNFIEYLTLGFAAILITVSLCVLSFIIYPINLALGIRLYRNPRYSLKTWARRTVIFMLVLSAAEISLLIAQMWMAYRKGSVEPLHLSTLKYWEHAKNMLVIEVLIAEALSLKGYTRKVDELLERLGVPTIEKHGVDGAEKGLLEVDVSPVEAMDEKMGSLATKEAIIVVTETENGSLKAYLLPAQEMEEMRESITPETAPKRNPAPVPDGRM